MPDQNVIERHADRQLMHTGGKAFADGSLLELIRGGPNGELQLLSWDGRSAKTASRFVRGEETFVPPPLSPAIMCSMQLPSGIAKYGSTRKLFVEISDLISRATQAGENIVLLITFFVFATWLADSLPAAPFLWVVTPLTTNAAPLEKLLGLLCRRAIIVSDISSAHFRALPTGLQPTLIAEIYEPTRRALNFLRASNRHSILAAAGKSMDAFCAKIVFAPEPLRDPASAGFPLELALPPTREYLPPMSAVDAERIAGAFQSKLLRYRLLNRAKVRAPKFDLNQFTVPMQQLAYSLAASITDDDELQSTIVPFLIPLDREIRAEGASTLKAIVLEVLLARCHGAEDKNFPVMEITRDVNTGLVLRGEMLEVSPEKVGWTLRALGLETRPITGGRMGLMLSKNVCEKLHELAQAYAVRTLRQVSAETSCSLCKQLALPQDGAINYL